MSFNLATKALFLFQYLAGLEEAFDWNRAYIVRAEAEEAVKFLD